MQRSAKRTIMKKEKAKEGNQQTTEQMAATETEPRQTPEQTAPVEPVEQEAPAEPQEDMSTCHESDTLQQAIDGLRQELEEQKDKYLRLNAEFDNYRKRTLREKQELIGRAAGDTLLRLLPVVDDFDLALKSAHESDNLEALREGLNIIHRSIIAFLKASGVQEIEAVGQELDTDFHDAITKMPAPTTEQKGKIIDVIRKGYLLNGSVIRHAQVIIGD